MAALQWFFVRDVWLWYVRLYIYVVLLELEQESQRAGRKIARRNQWDERFTATLQGGYYPSAEPVIAGGDGSGLADLIVCMQAEYRTGKKTETPFIIEDTMP